MTAQWISAFSMAIFLAIMGWIGMNVSHIPVIEVQIALIKEEIAGQVNINVKRLDDHENRLREIEKRQH